jgi:hypothetical protein
MSGGNNISISKYQERERERELEGERKRMRGLTKCPPKNFLNIFYEDLESRYKHRCTENKKKSSFKSHQRRSLRNKKLVSHKFVSKEKTIFKHIEK